MGGGGGGGGGPVISPLDPPGSATGVLLCTLVWPWYCTTTFHTPTSIPYYHNVYPKPWLYIAGKLILKCKTKNNVDRINGSNNYMLAHRYMYAHLYTSTPAHTCIQICTSMCSASCIPSHTGLPPHLKLS